jgi:hypothetical protein
MRLFELIKQDLECVTAARKRLELREKLLSEELKKAKEALA